MSFSKFSLTNVHGEFVSPSEQTPSLTLPLSSIDQYFMLGMYVNLLLVYKQGNEPAKLIKESLRKVLVHYYPLAGRLSRSEQGVVQVACTAAGVWFSDALAGCSLEQMDEMGIVGDVLLPSLPDPAGVPLMIQVTEFSCGGYGIGIKFDHGLTDGMGVGQILTGVAEMARGLDHLSIQPTWLREHIPNPSFPPSPPPMLHGTHLEYLVVDVSLARINHIKDQFIKYKGQTCSSFDVVVATLWQNRVKAINLDPAAPVHLHIAYSVRRQLCSLLPGEEEGYYGNCSYFARPKASSGQIVNSSIVEVIEIIREAKKRAPEKFTKWAMGEQEEDAYVAVPWGYAMLGVTDWRWLGFNGVDFGSGPPTYFGPILQPGELSYLPMCVITKVPVPKEGVRLMSLCVAKEHLESFRDKMLRAFSNVETA